MASESNERKANESKKRAPAERAQWTSPRLRVLEAKDSEATDGANNDGNTLS
ncbi:MAG TPA: hypothetical protein VMU08_14285 [Rhizomicrobium sp.]|nr:hypothetical protein [Rhizomicrobium sp.]